MLEQVLLNTFIHILFTNKRERERERRAASQCISTSTFFIQKNK